MTAPVVIVGAGQAAASFISRHIALGNEQPLVLIGDESHPPYQRPPLSKKYLLGELDRERLFIRPLDWYQSHSVVTHLDTRVSEIHPEQQQVITDTGDRIDYSSLILATGSSARQLPGAIGGDLKGVFTLRSMADIDQMQPEFTSGKRLLIVGGGYIGLEAAAVGRQLGLDVTLIEMADRIMQRVASAETSDYFRRLHQGRGVEIQESAKMVKLTEENGCVTGAELESGEIVAADIVLVGIGGSPNSELAEAAGLDCNNGIMVDAQCRSSNANIFAAGDCCSFERNGERIRLESVQNASDQGDLIARVLAGEAVSYNALPWFWSDQYDCKLQIVGLNQGHNSTVVRPGADESSQSIWYFKDDQLIAIDAMNEPKSYAFGRMIIEKGKQPTPAEVADPATDLKAIAKS
ncbi:MAG: FAD-dependent oxidoreductase [Pseudomonadota bacterium]